MNKMSKRINRLEEILDDISTLQAYSRRCPVVAQKIAIIIQHLENEAVETINV